MKRALQSAASVRVEAGADGNAISVAAETAGNYAFDTRVLLRFVLTAC